MSEDRIIHNKITKCNECPHVTIEDSIFNQGVWWLPYICDYNGEAVGLIQMDHRVNIPIPDFCPLEKLQPESTKIENINYEENSLRRSGQLHSMPMDKDR